MRQLRSTIRVELSGIQEAIGLVRSKVFFVAFAVAVLLTITLASAQQHQDQSPKTQSMSSSDGMTMQHDDPSREQEMNAATQMMSSHHMDMGPHMKMTELRPVQPGDQEKAERVVEEARRVIEKYQDYHAALNDGFKIFLPNVPQQQYHFTNYWYGFEAAFRFNPEHPTSLLYDKTPEGYKLAGVMYTAPAKADENELNDRIPLSVAQWHEHINFCFPPKERNAEMWQKNPKFGMAGSISTKEACDEAGGKFVPLLFGWMVHLYPNEKDMWATGPGMHHEH
ncbi:MAG TPA: hypothetical protein VM912_10500 [Terriglobales bacterium]|nr:hypothetical protein [Terriglobales bacterium]